MFGRRPKGRQTPDDVEELLQAFFTTFGNASRMLSCTMLWRTETAAVGICPAYDDLLVWLDMSSPALSVRITEEVCTDFRKEVLPRILHYVQASREFDLKATRASIDWALAVSERVARGEIHHGDPLPERPLIDREEVKDAYRAVTAALDAFLQRHEHRPDV